MSRQVISQQPGKPFSRGTKVGNLLFVSGQMGIDENDKPVPGGIDPQMRRTMDWVVEILAEGGATLDDVQMVNNYMADLATDYATMNKIYFEYFGEGDMPARATVEVRRLAMDLLVEISCIATVKS